MNVKNLKTRFLADLGITCVEMTFCNNLAEKLRELLFFESPKKKETRKRKL